MHDSIIFEWVFLYKDYIDEKSMKKIFFFL